MESFTPVVQAHDGHEHGFGDHHSGSALRVLLVVLVATVTLMVVEVVAGVLTHALVLEADAAHLFSDAVSLVIAVGAQVVATRPVTARHSFGWRRAEVLAAQLNGLLLLCASVWIAVDAVQRLGSPGKVAVGGLITVATVGLLTNVILAAALHRTPGHNMNVRAAAVHVVSDAMASLGAVLAGLVIWIWGAAQADPLISFGIAFLVVVAAARLLVDTTHVLLEGTPKHINPAEVEQSLLADDAVMAVHHLHVWALAPGAIALSAHVELNDPATLHDAQAHGERLKARLAQQFGVGHSTLELECHPCETPEDVCT